jgi:glycosyltransferase involved in cell wall biosynthesis
MARWMTRTIMRVEPHFRVLVFVVAYNAERTITHVLARIPQEELDHYGLEVLVIDDASQDRTFERGNALRRDPGLRFPLHVLRNPENQGYGGNQKIGFHYAIAQGFDFVALLHGDGQYQPESLPDLLEPLAVGHADAVLGSRMMPPGRARAGGMPLYKFVGNRILSTLQNRLLGAHLTEFHSGYRVYSTAALRKVPFDLNTNDFHFDTEIIIQLLRAEQRIVEVPIPTYYGDEICHVNGIKYAKDVLRASLKARVQEMDLLYDRKFDCRPADQANEQYRTKLAYESTHSYALDLVPSGAKVLDLGCGDGRLAQALRERGCEVTGIDAWPLPNGVELDAFHQHDLNSLPLPVPIANFDYVLLLDVIEHLRDPEGFVAELRSATAENPDVTFVISSGNVAFMPTRLLLLVGQFNYGKRGILDMTHTRLFTFSTLRRLLESAGMRIEQIRGVPAPFAEAVGDGRLGGALLRLNRLLIRTRPPAFAYQMFFVARPRPSLPYLLKRAEASAAERSEAPATV